MFKWFCLVLVLSCFSPKPVLAQATSYASPAVSSYEADPRPRSGLGGVIVGISGFAGGALALAIIPVCFAPSYPSSGSEGCAIGQGILGALGITAGIIGLSIGLPRRAEYREWRARQQGARGARPSGLSLAAAPGGGLLRYGLAF